MPPPVPVTIQTFPESLFDIASSKLVRKHSAEIGRVFADANPKELQILDSVLNKAGKRARALREERSKTRSR
jgi:hypothetical protein